MKFPTDSSTSVPAGPRAFESHLGTPAKRIEESCNIGLGGFVLGSLELPIGSLVVPFWGYLIGF